jgi:exosortase
MLGGGGLVLAVLGYALGLQVINGLALRTAGLLMAVLGGLVWFQGVGFVRRHGFALGFLIFTIPMPTGVEHVLEIFFQNTSAEVSYWMFLATGTSVLRSGRVFELPGLVIEVAQECSGIRSSYVLFIVSLLAGHMLLRRRWLRVGLTVFVVPLGILRNAFRIVTISLLTIHVDPGVISSPLHHRGGPLFFVLSLVPFLLLVWVMQRFERAHPSPSGPANSNPPPG